MFKKKLAISSVLAGIITFAVLNHTVSASEGIVELRNTVGDNSRCFVASVLMEDLNYNVLISCRDILYPGGTDIFRYTVWANPLDGSGPKRLGDIGLGKVLFRTKVPFVSLFVTKEHQSFANKPSGDVVMQGSLQPIEILASNTPSSNNATPAPELGEPEPSPTPKPKSSFSILRVGGVIGFIALFATILLVFVLTRR